MNFEEKLMQELLRPGIQRVKEIQIAYHNKKHKINPIPKRMCILNIVHDRNPAFQTDNLLKREKSCFDEYS